MVQASGRRVGTSQFGIGNPFSFSFFSAGEGEKKITRGRGRFLLALYRPPSFPEKEGGGKGKRGLILPHVEEKGNKKKG